MAADAQLQRASRLSQVSGVDRSDKIRTYNYQQVGLRCARSHRGEADTVQDRVTDHRVPVTINNLRDVVSGGPTLDSLVEVLEETDEEDRLKALLAGEPHPLM